MMITYGRCYERAWKEQLAHTEGATMIQTTGKVRST